MKFTNTHLLLLGGGAILGVVALSKLRKPDQTDEAFVAEAYAAAAGAPKCGYNSSNGCCGLPAIGGNCPATLNFQSLGTNNPCPGCYSQPNGGRHHCCPDKPPYNGGGPCVCAKGGYGGGGGGASTTTPADTTTAAAPAADTTASTPGISGALGNITGLITSHIKIIVIIVGAIILLPMLKKI
jgi:hypothetical protein